VALIHIYIIHISAAVATYHTSRGNVGFWHVFGDGGREREVGMLGKGRRWGEGKGGMGLGGGGV
jgi:hypothetical protein